MPFALLFSEFAAETPMPLIRHAMRDIIKQQIELIVNAARSHFSTDLMPRLLSRRSNFSTLSRNLLTVLGTPPLPFRFADDLFFPFLCVFTSPNRHYRLLDLLRVKLSPVIITVNHNCLTHLIQATPQPHSYSILQRLALTP